MAQQDEYKPINTGDGVTLKAQLDDNIIKVLGETGFTEDHFWSNVKLLLLSGASIVALVAQFYPMPFPDSRTLLAVCCVLYVCAPAYDCVRLRVAASSQALRGSVGHLNST